MGLIPTFSPDSELATHPINVGFHFYVMVGLETLGDFHAVEGISIEQNVFKYSEGGRNHSTINKRWDGPARRGEVTLRWGMLSRPALYQWMMAVERGYFFRKDVYILQLDRQKSPLRLIRLSSAFPVRWNMGAIDANSNSWAVEELVLTYDDVNVLVIPTNILAFFSTEILNTISGVGRADFSDSEDSEITTSDAELDEGYWNEVEEWRTKREEERAALEAEKAAAEESGEEPELTDYEKDQADLDAWRAEQEAAREAEAAEKAAAEEAGESTDTVTSAFGDDIRDADEEAEDADAPPPPSAFADDVGEEDEEEEDDEDAPPPPSAFAADVGEDDGEEEDDGEAPAPPSAFGDDIYDSDDGGDDGDDAGGPTDEEA
ncbi:MAG: phage tail protein [Alphaproteobacteria bacterium]|nr:phage tail protein [Alphaproteobacteria bacterium]